MSLTSGVGAEGGMAVRRTPAWAWGLCWLMFASTVLNYMDRQAVAVVGEKITGEFKIGFEDFGWVIAAFQISYALFQVPAGFMADRWNVRWTYAGAVLWWSTAAIAVALAPTLGILMLCRALLGLGEAFNWPCALKVTSKVLPPADRSLGNGIFNSGAAVGAVVTPLVVTPLTLLYGWRTAFVVIGAAGFVWVAVWLFLTGKHHRGLFEVKKFEDTRPAGSRRGLTAPARLAFALLAATVLGIVLAGQLITENVPVVMPTKGKGSATSESLIRGVQYRVQEGDQVRSGDTLAEIDTGTGEPIVLTAGESGVVRLLSPAADASGAISADKPLLELVTYPHRLDFVWWGIAVGMVGLLLVSALLPLEWLEGAGWASSLGHVVRLRRFWVLVAVSVSVNVCWHFLVNWLPTYLKTDRGMAFVAGSLLSAIPFLAADVGNLAGGELSRRLAHRGLEPARARLFVLTGCVFLIVSGVFVGVVTSNVVTIGLLALMALGTAAFMANYFSFCQEVSPTHTGLIVGILGGLGNLFAAGFSPIAGRIKDTTGSFGLVFVVVGLLPFVGLAALWLAWGRDGDQEVAGDEGGG